MTSETEAIKTNEFLRRRKLRLQQVREQSKDIAKKIRQRAKVENLRQVVDLDAKKQKEYFECQEKLVKRLEVLYARGLENVGASHQSASELTQHDEVAKTDLSKVRGKEATAELRRKKQEKLDSQKKILDRKLQAREAANEISRDKSTVIANKLLSKPSSVKVSDEPYQKTGGSSELAISKDNNKGAEKINNESEAVKTSDMATQWDMETIPHEWEPAVPALSLPTDKDTPKDSDDYVGIKDDKSKRLDLFAVSKEMPSSLRGKHTHEVKEREPGRPSLTIVSEYLQNRKLRLRESEPMTTNKKAPDDMQSLKQTILRTRSAKPEGSPFNVCQVLDEQIIPMPTWQAERKCQLCPRNIYYNTHVASRQFKSVTNSQINKIFSSIRPVRQADLLPSPVLRGTSPFRRSKVGPRIFPGKGSAFNDKTKNIDNTLQRKSSVLMYNHSTRDTRDLPCDDDLLVLRDVQSEEDAYSQALKEVSVLTTKDKDQHKKVQDMRNKVAVTKQNVEKEYKDTMNFLNSLPKDRGTKVIKNAYMDERRQLMQHENRQRKMQQEYKKIEKECKKHHINCLRNRSQSKSPAKQDIDDNFDSRDFQYSWMPVPESDGNLAIHAIPNTVKQGKTGNCVKFSKVDSYHEYRSRHKHTPPTKDTTQDKQPSKKVFEKVLIDENATESSDSSSFTSDTSSVINMKIETKRKRKTAKEINRNLSDAERIIIYKVLESKPDRKSKKQTKLLNEIAKSLTCIQKVHKTVSEDVEKPKVQKSKHIQSTSKSADNGVSFEQINEGVYKMVEEQGDNVASMYFDKGADAQSDDNHIRSCLVKNLSNNQHCDRGTALHWECGELSAQTTNKSQCPSASKETATKLPTTQPSTAPSTSSFITATNDKVNASEGGYIKLVDETGLEAGKFFIGASGFLDNNTYEVVIQLRKKDGMPQEDRLNNNTELSGNQNQQSGSEINNRGAENCRLANSETDAKHVPPGSNKDVREVLADRSDDKRSSVAPVQPDPNILPEGSNMPSNKNEKYQTDTTNTETNDEIFLIKSASINKDMCDKGVHTNFTEEPKSDQLPRLATTTYTQTTLSSPVHRPVFFHMSSSTSTAYMSPPETILPKFLKHDRGHNGNQMYDPIETVELTEKEYCDEYVDCNCRKCMFTREVKVRKNKYENNKIITPPNSAANSSLDQRHEAKGHTHDRNEPCKSANIDKPKCLHHHHRKVDPVKRQCHRSKKSSVENIRSSRNLASNSTSRNGYKSAISSRDIKQIQSSLNPIIKDYVNKLLALNREGLKAVEVADQDCSSVGTPGSSIINVPFNIDERKTSSLHTISIEQIKKILKKQMADELTKKFNDSQNSLVYSATNSKNKLKYSSSRTSYKKKPLHKVKYLNISKHLLKQNKIGEKLSKPISQSSTEQNLNARVSKSHTSKKSRSQSSPTPRQVYTSEPLSRFNDSESTAKNSTGTERTNERHRSGTTIRTKSNTPMVVMRKKTHLKRNCGAQLRSHRATATESTIDSESTGEINGYENSVDIPVSMSTQTTQNMDINTDKNFMKLAEDKLCNMEKIADLTEKCTKRLSNLAKVLQEVRKNKSLAYSQISSAESTDSQSDHKSDKPLVSPTPFDPNNIPQTIETKSPELNPDKENIIENEISRSGYINILSDIPKPELKVPESNELSRPKSADKIDSFVHLSANTSELLIKSRPKPPPALSRLNSKHGQEYVTPHELSTVIEVDSPMSMKQKTQSARNDVLKDASNNSNGSSPADNVTVEDYKKSEKESNVNPDLLQKNTIFLSKYKLSSTESSDDSKFQMIDLKQFNEIMLEPFITIQEYAKQYNMEPPDEGSNLEEIQRDDAINDDMSSLRSDGSLPDVIAELLKRNIITEPFKFDTASNVNSTTISSESTLSMLALSKVRRDRKRTNFAFKNKENIGETSDTLSISSNPDLENAFKKLGMGWASSTLKKTKERLALSSSSNTSSSSSSQFKIKSVNQDIPVLVTDSVSSAVNVNKSTQIKNTIDNSKNAGQQTSLSNSMTVKEFLRNELSKKITFTNKSNVNDTQEEFVSLFETKMPEEMKDTSQINRNERSMDSAPSAANRARTSTPVQLFKSMTYHSSSSSNVSNGLFSNADDLSSVKVTSNSMKNHSTSDKDDLTIPNFSLRMKKSSDCSKSD